MSEDSIFREVDDDLRSERTRRLWRRIAPYVIGAAVAVVLLVAANEGYQWWQESNAARSSDQLYTALELAEAGDIAAAQQALETVALEGSGNYPALARFKQASLLARDGRTEEAVAAYDALSTAGIDQRLREMALILAAFSLVDTGDAEAVRSRVGGFIEPQNPMRNLAREAVGLTLYAAGDLEGALASFEEIVADATVSQDMSGRVRIYIDQLVAEGAGGSETVMPVDGASAGQGQDAAGQDAANDAEGSDVPALQPAFEAPAADEFMIEPSNEAGPDQ